MELNCKCEIGKCDFQVINHYQLVTNSQFSVGYQIFRYINDLLRHFITVVLVYKIDVEFLRINN